MTTTIRRWHAKLGTMTGRGFDMEPFAAFLLGPVVHAAAPDELLDASIEVFVSRSITETPS